MADDTTPAPLPPLTRLLMVAESLDAGWDDQAATAAVLRDIHSELDRRPITSQATAASAATAEATPPDATPGQNCHGHGCGQDDCSTCSVIRAWYANLDDGRDQSWRVAVLGLASVHYDAGHRAEDVAYREDDPVAAREWWATAWLHRNIYGELCALVHRVDPRPGGDDPSKPSSSGFPRPCSRSGRCLRDRLVGDLRPGFAPRPTGIPGPSLVL